MTVQFIEGFEVRRTTDLQDDVYEESPVSLIFSNFKVGRFFGFAYEGHITNRQWLTKTLQADDVWGAGIAAQIRSSATGEVLFMSFQDDDKPQMSLYVVRSTDGGRPNDYTLKVYRGDGTVADDTELAESALIDGAEGYHYYEFKTIINGTTGSWVVRQNGLDIMSQTGVNTKNASASGTADRFRFGSERHPSSTVGAPFFDLDDIYVINGLGTESNDLLGDQIVEGALPSAIGNSTDWAAEDQGSPSGNPNWEEVNDDSDSSSSPDDDDGYVRTGLTSNKDLYTFEDLQFISGEIKAVMLDLRVRIDSSGSEDIQQLFRPLIGNDEDAGSPLTINTTIWDDYLSIISENPQTAAPFTVAEFNGGQWGYEKTS